MPVFYDIRRYLTDKYFDIVWGCHPPGNPPNGPPKSIFWTAQARVPVCIDIRRYLTDKYFDIVWGGTSTIHLHLASFYAIKYFWKKLKGMHTEQNLELREPQLHGRIRTPLTGCFHDKTKIFMENLGMDCYLRLKYCRRQCTLLPLTWAKSLTKFNSQMQDFKQVLDLNCKQKKDWTNQFSQLAFKC